MIFFFFFFFFSPPLSLSLSLSSLSFYMSVHSSILIVHPVLPASFLTWRRCFRIRFPVFREEKTSRRSSWETTLPCFRPCRSSAFSGQRRETGERKQTNTNTNKRKEREKKRFFSFLYLVFALFFFSPPFLCLFLFLSVVPLLFCFSFFSFFLFIFFVCQLDRSRDVFYFFLECCRTANLYFPLDISAAVEEGERDTGVRRISLAEETVEFLLRYLSKLYLEVRQERTILLRENCRLETKNAFKAKKRKQKRFFYFLKTNTISLCEEGFFFLFCLFLLLPSFHFFFHSFFHSFFSSFFFFLSSKYVYLFHSLYHSQYVL